MSEERILVKLDQLNQYLSEIREDPPQDMEEYRDQRRKFERLLHLSVETVIDISSLVLKREGVGVPSDEESVFDKLIEGGVYSEQLGEVLKDMKGFRNVLVHRYGEVNDEEVFNHLDRLEDFERFRDVVKEYLSEG